MKLTLENYCEADQKITIWDYRVTRIGEINESHYVEVYQCRSCKCYSSKNYLKKMEKNK